jgi:hypothetical protein
MFYLRAFAAGMVSFWICISTTIAAETVLVDFSADGGEIRHRANGFLHAFSDDGQWAKWEDFVTRMVQEARRRGLNPQWDIWNEPDHHFFWQRSPEQFYETWHRAYAKIRQVDPAAVIVGPSWSNVHPGQPRFAAFVRFCKKQQAVPDYLCWHFPRDTVKEAGDCRQLLSTEGTRVKGLMVNELPVHDHALDVAILWSSDRDAFTIRLGPGR